MNFCKATVISLSNPPRIFSELQRSTTILVAPRDPDRQVDWFASPLTQRRPSCERAYGVLLVAIDHRDASGSYGLDVTMRASNFHAQLLLSFPHTMLKNLFGGKKQEGFFLDLSDGQSAPTPDAAPTVATPPAPIATPEPVAAAPVAVASAAPVAETPASAPAAPVEAPVEAPAPEPASVNFATVYLQPSGQGAPRRRPSANMSGFLDMARNVRG